jgi:hypothetical protein
LSGVVAALIAGCSPTQAYPGVPRAEGELATIEGCGDCEVERLDGQPLPGSPTSQWHVLPGEHEVEFRFADSFEHGASLSVPFLAKAGSRYRVTHILVGEQHELAAPDGRATLEMRIGVVVEEPASSATCYFGWGRIVAGRRSLYAGAPDPGIVTCPTGD